MPTKRKVVRGFAKNAARIAKRPKAIRKNPRLKKVPGVGKRKAK